MSPRVRPARMEDRETIIDLAQRSGLFSSEDIPFIESRMDFEGTAKWLIAETDAPLGVIYGDIEAVTDSTWNALMLIVAPEAQSQGVGRLLMTAFEESARAEGGRILIVETSSGEGLESARAFYPKLGFREESRISAFYAEGHDKITFWKRLREGGEAVAFGEE